MSAPIGAIAGAVAATSAAAAAKRMRKEEEDMTRYNNDDLEGWEFKILRAGTAKFKNYDLVRRVCEQEARAGWEMVEKFDDYRIRFKRRIDQRKNDQFLDFDPYRTYVGLGSGALGGIIGGSILLAALIALGVVFATQSGGTSVNLTLPVIGVIVLVLGIVVAIVKNRKGI